MLKDSVSDLRSTLADLEKRLNSVDGEGVYMKKDARNVDLRYILLSKITYDYRYFNEQKEQSRTLIKVEPYHSAQRTSGEPDMRHSWN